MLHLDISQAITADIYICICIYVYLYISISIYLSIYLSIYIYIRQGLLQLSIFAIQLSFNSVLHSIFFWWDVNFVFSGLISSMGFLTDFSFLVTVSVSWNNSCWFSDHSLSFTTFFSLSSRSFLFLYSKCFFRKVYFQLPYVCLQYHLGWFP